LASKKAALDFVDTRVQPGDEIGIVSLDVFRGPVLNEYLTTDYSKIREVINEIGAKKYLGRAADAQSDYLKSLEEVASALGDDLKDMIGNLIRQEERTYEVQAGDFIKAIETFSKVVRYISGNKSIVLFSSGIANYVLYGSQKYLTSSMSRFGDTYLRGAYIDMCKSLAASN